MQRTLRVFRTIASLLAIEICVPGGTLIVVALLLTGRANSPFAAAITRRFPGLSRLVARAV